MKTLAAGLAGAFALAAASFGSAAPANAAVAFGVTIPGYYGYAAPAYSCDPYDPYYDPYYCAPAPYYGGYYGPSVSFYDYAPGYYRGYRGWGHDGYRGWGHEGFRGGDHRDFRGGFGGHANFARGGDHGGGGFHGGGGHRGHR